MNVMNNTTTPKQCESGQAKTLLSGSSQKCQNNTEIELKRTESPTCKFSNAPEVQKWLSEAGMM